jgi:site-specific recombinase XerD
VMRTFEQTIESYLRRWQPTLRPLSIRSKRGILRRFVRYLQEEHPDLCQFSQVQRRPHIENWLERLLYLKATSRNTQIRTLRLFFEDMIRWQWPDAPPPGLLADEDLAPEDSYLPRPLPPDLDQSVQKAFVEAGTFGAMALLLLRYTGMRIGEMRALPLNAMETVGPNTSTLRVPVGKTYSERLIPLDSPTVALIERIIAQRAHRQKRPLPDSRRHLMMVDQWGRHLTQQSYSRIIRDLTAHIDTTERIYCHRLRHTFATEMARAGMPVPVLMKLLGHKTPKMTMRYVEVAQPDVRQAYDQALTQLTAIRSIQSRTLPALPASSSTLPQLHEPGQLLKLMALIIASLEKQRRDAQDPSQAKQLQTFIKRIRKAVYDLNDIL